MENPQDAISLRLVQSCYMATGDSKNTLNCMARCMHTFDESYHLHGHMLGMLCAGYLENGLYTEADQVGSRAVERTRGRDVWAMHSLLNTYQIAGRASEGVNILEAHQSKNICTGQQLLLFNQGCLLVHNGNYIGAARAADLLIASLQNSDVSLVSSFTNAAFLLWLISLHKFDAHLASMWLALSKLLSGRTGNSRRFPIDDVAHVMTLTMTSNLNNIVQDPGKSSEDVAQAPDNKMAERKMSDVIADNFRDWFIHAGHGKSSAQVHNESVQEGFEHDVIVNQDTIDACLSVLSAYRSDRNALAHEISIDFNHLCPTLLQVSSSYTLSYKYSDISGGLSDYLWTQTPKFTIPLQNFADQQYTEAAQELNRVRSNFLDLGSIRPHRDILEQTMVESYLRDEQLDNAKLLLCERYIQFFPTCSSLLTNQNLHLYVEHH